MKTGVQQERLITFLLGTPMFEALEARELMDIVPIIEKQSIKTGDTIFREHDDGDAWYVVHEGEVEVLKNTESGEKSVSRLGPQTCFGEIAILDGSPRSATIRASTDGSVLCIRRSAFEDLLNDGNTVAYKLLHQIAIVLAARERATTGKLLKLLAAQDGEVQEGIRAIVESSVVRE